MYAVDTSVAVDCYLCVLPDPGIEAAPLGAGEAAALGASASAAPGAGESALSGLYLPSFSTNLVSGADLQDRGVDQLSFGTTALVTPPCLVSEAWPPVSLSLVSLGLSLPYLRGWPYLPRLSGQGQERYFLLVVDDYSRYTTVFPLRSKGDVTEVIDLIRAARLQLRESFGSDFPVPRLHSDRGGEFSSARLGAFCRAQGIRQTFMLPTSPQQNGIAERRIGMVMDVARMSMMHAAAPHFLWPFAVQYAAHQLNLQPRVSLPETSPAMRWTGCPRVLFPDAPGWQFYHPTSRRVLSSQDVTFDESVPYYRLFPYRTAPLPPPPLFFVPGPPLVDPLPRQPGGAECGGAEPGGAEFGGAKPRGAEPGGAGSARVAAGGASSMREPLSPQEMRECFARRWRRAAVTRGAIGATGVGPARAAGGGGAAGAGAAGGVGAGVSTGAGASRGATEAAGADGPTGVGATGAGATGGVGAGGAAGASASEGTGVGAIGAGGSAGARAAAGGTAS
ncbi:unnamed protein product [Closterium sp. NIES-65]|nr:unnamed protein product [Closterium sp. NIES-65]